MIILLDKLKDGSHRQQWSGVLDRVDLVYPEAQASVDVEANIHRLRDLITIRGDISATLERPCDRCLEPAEVDLETPLHVIIQIRSVGSDVEEGDDGEFIVTVSDEETELDITELIRDRMIVDMPMVVHCTDACRGLCPECGANLNEEQCSCNVKQDPRWDSLKSVDFDQ